jgi:hypothetical protein
MLGNKLYTTSVRAVENAILSLVRLSDGIASSWSEEQGEYLAYPTYAEYWNGREQGYVISLQNLGFPLEQINIAFFEHRNSDDICMIVWEEVTYNPPTAQDLIDNNPEYAADKYAVTKTFAWNQIAESAQWINNTLEEWWESKT